MHIPKARFLILLVLLLLPLVPAQAQQVISYQGRLYGSGGLPVTDSTYAVAFALYTDSVAGSMVWQEAAAVTTRNGLFDHLLGSQTDLYASLFQQHSPLFLQLTVEGEAITPRTRMTAAAAAMVADHLRITDTFGQVVGRARADSGGTVLLHNHRGDSGIVLRGGWTGDSAVVLPDSSVNASEILDEPGVASLKNTQIMDLSEGAMTDLVVLEIEIPADGFIVLYGKCYAVLSGTTGPNGAKVQIDQEEGGPALFPYYTQAGLSGYVNTGDNYFPMFVTRVFYREAGIHEFRLEGLATHPLPALAQTWDHILTAVYYPSAYGWISTILASPAGFPGAVPIELDDPRLPNRTGTVYDVDLRTMKKEPGDATGNE